MDERRGGLRACEPAVDHERLRIEQCVEALRHGDVKELILGVPTTYPVYESVFRA
ncbi:hypothetical protein ACFRMQ_34905 [Kitasatospora sp. NPDC056783]|uniref:hypothetical protein n=1 Tax=Kitasatospora sp. NPDC056783 TaxID=3345943 RepID=UPI0036BE3669